LLTALFLSRVCFFVESLEKPSFFLIVGILFDVLFFLSS